MKILSMKEIKEVDLKTLKYEDITLLELANKAASAFYTTITPKLKDYNREIVVFCGIGNNGLDGLIIAYKLHKANFKVIVYIVNSSSTYSDDFIKTLDKLRSSNLDVLELTLIEGILPLSNTIIIDAIFGTELSRGLSDLHKEVINKINNSNSVIYSVDIPSGLFLDKPTDLAIEATETITFQIPKLCLLLPNNYRFVGALTIVDIELNQQAISEAVANTYFMTLEDIAKNIKKIDKYAHKGTQGHALIIGGSIGKIGAAILSAKAALKSGSGLVTVYTPKCGTIPLQSNCPELMVIEDIDNSLITNINFDIKPSSIAIGMGMGTNDKTRDALKFFLSEVAVPLIIDADALNILSGDKDSFKLLKENTILTPHPGELRRLIGDWKNDFDKLELTQLLAKQYNVIIIIKGAYTAIVNPQNIYINSSGLPSLATSGSGDVLSGVIAGLLAQGYPPLEAAKIGVYIHGMTANVNSKDINEHSFTSHDIIENISNVYNIIYKVNEYK